jgi:hypothetical protein
MSAASSQWPAINARTMSSPLLLPSVVSAPAMRCSNGRAASGSAVLAWPPSAA